MTEFEFDRGMQLLTETFGPKVYSPPRTKALWNMVRERDGKWFYTTCEYLAGSCRYPPLIPEFERAIEELKQKSWFAQTRNPIEELKPMENSIFSSKEIAEMKNVLSRCVKGEITSAQLQDFMGQIQKTVQDINPPPCRLCCGDGVLMATKEKINYAFRCYCRFGAQRTENFPVYQRGLGYEPS